MESVGRSGRGFIRCAIGRRNRCRGRDLALARSILLLLPDHGRVEGSVAEGWARSR